MRPYKAEAGGSSPSTPTPLLNHNTDSGRPSSSSIIEGHVQVAGPKERVASA